MTEERNSYQTNNWQMKKHLARRAVQNCNKESHGRKDNNHYGNNGQGMSFPEGTAVPQNNNNGSGHGNSGKRLLH